MVKAGVYLLIRLAPALAGTLSGVMVSFIGGFTFNRVQHDGHRPERRQKGAGLFHSSPKPWG